MKDLTHLTILLLKGCPGVGKSTFARQFIKNNSNRWIIVNRDNIREMLGNYWVPDRENLVSDIEIQVISFAINRHFNVIVDATNLNGKMEKYCKSFIEKQKQFGEEELDIKIEYKEFKLPLWRLYFNDFKRRVTGGRSVGFKVIKQFYNKYYKIEKVPIILQNKNTFKF
jgi:predicted kinase